MALDNAFDNPICQGCISRFKEKHPGEPWQIPCEGIVTDVEKIYPAEQLVDLSAGDREHLEHIHNRVKWAKERLEWTAYPYQEEELLCSSRRTVLRFGRQTGKTDVVSVKILHSLALNPHRFEPGTKVLGIVPHQSQSENIYDRVIELAERDPTIWSRFNAKKTPHVKMTCEGTGRFHLFCAGTAAKSGAGTVRGQPADEVYIDEADFLGAEDWSTILPIINSKPTNRFTMCSTPIKQRGRLYRHSHDPTYRETHVTIYDKPGVTEEQIRAARAECDTEMDWILEYLAEFGDAIQGVYQAAHINRALEDYELGYVHTDTPVYIGVDWNKGAVGDWVAVMADVGGKIKLIDLICISAKDRTQLAAVEAIAGLNRKYPNCRAIYCDDGFGETQIELLWAMGKEADRDHIDSRLRDIVFGIEFNKQIEIVDQQTNKSRRTKTKPYMTNRTAVYMEEGLVTLPKSLDVKDLLGHQMRNYMVVKRTDTGVPVYSDGAQHALIAWQLGLFAYDQTDGDLSRKTHSVTGVLKVPAQRTPDKLDSAVKGSSAFHTLRGRGEHTGRSLRTGGARRSRAFSHNRSRALNI